MFLAGASFIHGPFKVPHEEGAEDCLQCVGNGRTHVGSPLPTCTAAKGVSIRVHRQKWWAITGNCQGPKYTGLRFGLVRRDQAVNGKTHFHCRAKGKELKPTGLGKGRKTGGAEEDRTPDLLNAIQIGLSCKEPFTNDLQNTPESVAPIFAPEIKKETILDALKRLDRDDLLALLNAALDSKDDGICNKV